NDGVAESSRSLTVEPPSELYFRRAAGGVRSLVLWSFAVEQNALAFDAPSIVGKRTVAAHDTMAKEWQRQDCSQRKLLPRRGPPSVRQCAAQSPNRRPLRRLESPGAPATRVAGKQCREYQGEDPSQSAAPRRTRLPEPPRLRSHDRRRRDAPSGSGLEGCAQACPD